MYNADTLGASLHFTLFSISAVPKTATNCQAKDDGEGPFVACHYTDFQWEMNRTYRRHISNIGNNFYTCTITDTVTGASFTTDALQTTYTGSNYMALQYLDPLSNVPCSEIPYSKSTFTMAQVTPPSALNTNVISPSEVCPKRC